VLAFHPLILVVALSLGAVVLCARLIVGWALRE
jgi:hypothetical protein